MRQLGLSVVLGSEAMRVDTGPLVEGSISVGSLVEPSHAGAKGQSEIS